MGKTGMKAVCQHKGQDYHDFDFLRIQRNPVYLRPIIN